MRIRHVTASVIAALAALAGAAAPAAESKAPAARVVPSGPGSISGIWTNIVYKHESVYEPRLGVLRTVDGRLPPLRPWAAELLEKRIRDSEAGLAFATTKSECLPSGVPQLMFGPRTPLQILETPRQVTMLIEEFNDFRIILLDAKHQEDPDPTFMGDSVGHWEGDTLVVDTIGLIDRTTLDVPGMPHSDALHIVERIRRADKDTLEVLVTIDDPKTFTHPWSAKTAFRLMPVAKITEYLCENQRNAAKDGISTMDMPAQAR
jgi:hypothetical protein